MSTKYRRQHHICVSYDEGGFVVGISDNVGAPLDVGDYDRIMTYLETILEDERILRDLRRERHSIWKAHYWEMTGGDRKLIPEEYLSY